MMKLEASLAGIASAILLWFALTRSAYSMGAMVFVATPLYVVAGAYFAYRVFRELRERDVL